ncbi:class I SAM-dependent methyltransferase [Chloroflexota bacterium]
MSREISKDRWLIGLEKEKEYNRKREDIEERLIERREVWARLLDSLKCEVSFDNSKRILDVGAEATSIFLALREGEKYAVDPLFAYLFELHPFLKEIEEYKDVNFISSPFQDMTSDKSFDIIFILAMLEHLGTLKPVVGKVDELLAPSSTLVVLVDCLSDPVVRNIVSFFDIYPYHPHHFVPDDITKLFSNYRLTKQEQISEIYRDCPSKERKIIRIYRIDKVIAKIWELSGVWARGRRIQFALRLILCYSLIFVIVLLRRKGKPIWPPLNYKPWLFVFQKP